MIFLKKGHFINQVKDFLIGGQRNSDDSSCLGFISMHIDVMTPKISKSYVPNRNKMGFP